jgi:hypothetical protein
VKAHVPPSTSTAETGDTNIYSLTANIDIEIPSEFTKNTTPKIKYVHAPLKKKKNTVLRNPLNELMNSNEFIRVVDENTEVDDE